MPSRAPLRPVAIRPPMPTATSSTTCPSASTLLPMILPQSMARIGTAAARISTTRLSFSCTTLCEIVMPKVRAVT